MEETPEMAVICHEGLLGTKKRVTFTGAVWCLVYHIHGLILRGIARTRIEDTKSIHRRVQTIQSDTKTVLAELSNVERWVLCHVHRVN